MFSKTRRRSEYAKEEHQRSCSAGGELTELQLEALPWHEAQLHAMFGRRAAADIIRPPMEPRQHTRFNSSLRKLEGRAGAEILWDTLRDSSHRKLLNQDRKIPSSLKKTYDAFVRELLLQNGIVPAKRNFSVDSDAHEIQQLLDKTATLNVKDLRHKMELMSRSSRINADRTQILSYNSSFPDLVNASGEEGIERYLPSWTDSQNVCTSSDDKSRFKAFLPELRAETGNTSSLKPGDSLLAIEDALSREQLHRQTRRTHELSKIHFLTEEEASCEGQFSKHFRGLQNERDNMVKPVDAEKTVGRRDKQGAKSSDPGETHTIGMRASTDLAPGMTQRRRLHHQVPSANKGHSSKAWEPLTLKALVEYSHARPTNGVGEFLNGRLKMFPLKVSN